MFSMISHADSDGRWLETHTYCVSTLLSTFISMQSAAQKCDFMPAFDLYKDFRNPDRLRLTHPVATDAMYTTTCATVVVAWFALGSALDVIVRI